MTEAGVSFSRVLMTVNFEANHTGCIYLGVFGKTNDNPLAVYASSEDAGFTWKLFPDGSLQLSDPTTGESVAQMRSNKDDNDSYSDGMTDVSNTNLNFSCGNMLVVTDSYSRGVNPRS